MVVTAGMRGRTNNAALATVVGVKGELDADIDATLFTLGTGACVSCAIVVLFLALPLSFAFPFAFLSAVCQDVTLLVALSATPSVISAAPGFRKVQRVQAGQSCKRRCPQTLHEPAPGMLCPGTRQCVEPMPVHRALPSTALTSSWNTP